MMPDLFEAARTVAVCDALGAPHEEWLHGRQTGLPVDSFTGRGGEAHPTVHILGGTALYGTWTDDTQIMLMAIDALHQPGQDPVAAYKDNLLAWHDGYFCAEGKRLDVGTQTRMSIARIRHHENPDPTRSAGNAALMTTAGVFFATGGSARLDLLGQMVRATHNSDGAVDAALDFHRLLCMLQEDPEPDAGTVFMGHELRSIPSDVPPTGWAVHTGLCAARTYLDTGGDLPEGMRAIIDAAGDTDSIGAAYGALCAAAGKPATGLLADQVLGQDVLRAAVSDTPVVPFDAVPSPYREPAAERPDRAGHPGPAGPQRRPGLIQRLLRR